MPLALRLQIPAIAHRMEALLMLNEIYKTLVTQYYIAKLYAKADVAYFVQLGWLTDKDYSDITGDNYVAPTLS